MNQKIYKKTVKIEKNLADKISQYLTEHDSYENWCESGLSEDRTISAAATFDNGYQMDVKCCGVQYDPNSTNTAWTEAVLFDDKGNELVCSDVSEDFFGQWELEHDGSKYIVDVEIDDSKKLTLKEKVDSIVKSHDGGSFEELVKFAYWYGREKAAKEYGDKVHEYLFAQQERIKDSRYRNMIQKIVGTKTVIYFPDYSGDYTDAFGNDIYTPDK